MTLLDGVTATCTALADHGWRDLLLQVSGGQFDMLASDLAAALSSPLSVIDRTVPGFDDFASAGVRAIEPMSPAQSLLYHALASPRVVAVAGNPLGVFPTPAQIEAVENYVYGAQPPGSQRFRDGDDSAIVVFALEYRPAARTPHRRHADLCFSRTGIARVGTTAAKYDSAGRQWAPLDADDPYAFRPRPVRYAPFVAISRPGSNGHFPDRFIDGDDQREFWVPIHKLFDGDECIDGVTIDLQWTVSHVNEKLRRFHLVMGQQGYASGWGGADLQQPPFRFTEGIAELSTDPDLGQGFVMPVIHPRLVEPASFNGEPLAMTVPVDLKPAAGSHSAVLEKYFSGLEVSPFGPMPITGLNQSLHPQGLAHPAPEILNARHQVLADGSEVNLNTLPGIQDTVAAGGYAARHFVDFTGDGWVGVSCAALAPFIPETRAAYSVVSGPDFFPYCDQLQLMEWADTLPDNIRTGLWAVMPRALSDTRRPPNQTLDGAGFAAPTGPGLADTTITAIVCQHIHHDQPAQAWPDEGLRLQYSLPDSASGVFDPGWDITTDAMTSTDQSQLYLAAYGLGTPFVEDMKICAALATYWPAVAPDAARTFQPDRFWPTVSPLTDQEIGIVGDLPWDGTVGPKRIGSIAEYHDIDYVDYVDVALAGRFTAALTAQIDFAEYTRRVWAMAWLYDALGIRLAPGDDPETARSKHLFQRMQDFLLAKANWTLLSFQAVTSADPGAQTAAAAAQVTLNGDHVYGGGVYRRGAEQQGPTFTLRHVQILAECHFYTDGQTMLLSSDGTSWNVAATPTSSS